MSNISDSSENHNPNSRGLDSGAWGVGDKDDEIARLRNAVDEHLRSLEGPKSPSLSHKPTPPSSAYSYQQADDQSSTSGKSVSNRSVLVALVAVTGIALGAAVFGSVASIFIVGSQRANTPGVTSQRPPKPLSRFVASSLNKQISNSPSRESAASATSRGEAERTEGRGNADSNAEASPESTAADRWQACLDQDRREVEPPQPGETWWPVVGPRDSLDDARRHCRADAFINRSGNAQISSFRDRDTATAFAEQLTQDSSHPWRFWVGDASVR